ncbi:MULTISPECIES: hypothetical protein [Sphingobium]|uniref:hypothetical protein n=1 Tax=Sphingobium TaxID=165695 RepID=UPI000E73A19D|nr:MULTISPECIES: hypothetical protein [Sphingobium]KAA9019288.1 hypothetical protein F4U94_03920 [Sphingobium limneticum]
MSQQRALVRVQLPQPDDRIAEIGETVEREGLDWKFEPVDPAEWAVWNANHRNDERVANECRRTGQLPDVPPPAGVYTPPEAIRRPTSGWTPDMKWTR